MMERFSRRRGIGSEIELSRLHACLSDHQPPEDDEATADMTVEVDAKPEQPLTHMLVLATNTLSSAILHSRVPADRLLAR